MKTIIAGSRKITNFSLVPIAVANSGFYITEVVCGMANGVDELGRKWAIENRIPIKHFPADWNTYGTSAGPIRNKEMANYANALIAIWDGKSRGTQNMIKEAEKKGLKVFVWDINQT